MKKLILCCSILIGISQYQETRAKAYKEINEYFTNIKEEAILRLGELEKKEVKGEQIVYVSLEDLITYYVALNKEVHQSYFNWISVKEQHKSIRGIYKPNFKYQYQQIRQEPTYIDDITLSQPTISEDIYELNQFTPWGISYYLRYSQRGVDPRVIDLAEPYNYNDTIVSSGDKIYSSGATIGVNIPLWKNLGNGGSYASQKSEVSAEIEELVTLQTIEQTVLSVIDLYWQVVIVIDMIENLQNKYELSLDLFKKAKQEEEQGLIGSTIKQQLYFNLITDENNLQIAKNDLITIEEVIKEAIGLSEVGYQFYPLDGLEIINFSYEQEEVEEKLKEHSIPRKQIEKLREIAILNDKEASNQRRYKVDLNANYSLYGSSIIEGGEEIVDNSDINGYMAALTIEIPLGDGGGFSASRASKFQLAKQEIDILKSDSAISLQSKQIIRNMNLLKKQVEAQELLVEISEDLSQAELVKYEQGESTPSELDEINNEKVGARLIYSQVLANYLTNFYSAVIGMGELGEYFPRLEEMITNINNKID